MSDDTKITDDGGPMFPIPSVGTGDPRDGMTRGHDGASLRDWFAGQALAGEMAAQSNDTGEWTNGVRDESLLNRSRLFYRFADAMLAVRKERLP